MSVDTYSFFLIVLSGFSFVWTFRKVSGSRHGSISDFEYLGFSSIWGVLILGLYTWVMRKHPDQVTTVLSNPFAAGVVLSMLGCFLGFLIGWLGGKVRRVFR